MTAEKQERIFPVDDEQLNLRALQALLTTAGYVNLEMISDARKVAPAHEHKQADLVLLDRVYRTGANGYIIKPFTAPELLAAVRDALASRAGPAGADDSVDDKQHVP